MKIPSNKFIIAFIAGLLAVLGFAPFSLFPLSVVALALLFVQWQRAENAWIAAKLGLAFGLGLFGAGVSWIYVALHDYGDMPFLLALPFTILFAFVLTLFPTLAGYTQGRLQAPVWLRVTLIMPVLWVLSEWLRGLAFTGFPWLALGYSQVDASPLVGYAPLLGVYGVSLAVAVSAGLLALLWQERGSQQGQAVLAVLVVLWFAGVALRTVEWTQPHGVPIKVSLIQGNIGQKIKFREENLVNTLETYRRMILSSDAKLIVLPESALPLMRSEVPESYLDVLSNHMRKNGGDIIIGSFDREQGSYYNSVFTLGTAEPQHYRKNHLVPFGEFIPLRPVLGWFINEFLNIPMSDLARGGIAQPPINAAGQKIAMNICYEDVFGEEIIRALPAADLLINVSNDAWYGNSHAAIQHNQISQMRALETGRMMLRATNTGVTSIISRSGHVNQMLPQHQEGVLTGMVQGYEGSTPYVRWGNTLVLGLLALMLLVAWALRRP
ncbi:MAG: apolipoprotein N-acyltransferase [Pseudomonadota bacterium]